MKRNQASLTAMGIAIVRALELEKPVGERIIFDYIDPSILGGAARHDEVRHLRRYGRFSGERLSFGIPIASIAAFLEARGFEQVLNADHVVLEKLYFSAGDRPTSRCRRLRHCLCFGPV